MSSGLYIVCAAAAAVGAEGILTEVTEEKLLRYGGGTALLLVAIGALMGAAHKSLIVPFLKHRTAVLTLRKDQREKERVHAEKIEQMRMETVAKMATAMLLADKVTRALVHTTNNLDMVNEMREWRKRNPGVEHHPAEAKEKKQGDQN